MKQLAALAASLCLLAFSPTPGVAAPIDGGWGKYMIARSVAPAPRTIEPSVNFPELWLLDQRLSGKETAPHSRDNASCLAGPGVGNATSLPGQRG